MTGGLLGKWKGTSLKDNIRKMNLSKNFNLKNTSYTKSFNSEKIVKKEKGKEKLLILIIIHQEMSQVNSRR